MTATYIETRDIETSKLKPFPGNARRGDVDTIRESLRRNGQYRSLVVRFTGDELIVLAGNHTLQALVAEGATTARCEIVECDDDDARRINLVDNRANERGETDDDALVELLSYMDGDYEGTGYTDVDVNKLLNPPHFDEEGDVESPAGVGDPVVSYQLVFDNEVQQSRWYEFVRAVKKAYPDMETLGERLHAYLGGLNLDDPDTLRGGDR